MEASEADKNLENAHNIDVQDDFAEKGEVLKAETIAERRLHLRSFDYWLSLKGEERTYPLFSDLRAEDLAPFKANSLLLEFNERGVVVRFIGDEIHALVDAPITVGAYLEEFPDCNFSQAMIEQFSEEEGRRKAAEFEFVEETTECRGMMLPFSSEGEIPNFIMVTASFSRLQTIETDAEIESFETVEPQEQVKLESDVSVDTSGFDNLVETYANEATTIIHKDQQTRTELYRALAHAYELYEQSETDSAVFSEVLKTAGLRQQARAPFTPVLKLVFGKEYDKTRLTEYAAALSCANRNGISSIELVEYLLNMPGGIKGCVQEERNYKRQKSGTPAHNRQKEAVNNVRQKTAISLKDISPNDEFCLILARRIEGGGVEALGCADTSQATLDTAIRQIASLNKN